MKMSLPIDEDLIDKARALAKSLGVPLPEVVNKALRLGLGVVAEGAAAVPYVTRPHAMGLRPGCSLDDVSETLTRAEDEAFR